MNFWDEKKREVVKKCPKCDSVFIIDKGVQCSTICSAKKTEENHKKIAEKMITHCFPRNKRVKIEFPTKTPLEIKEIRWGWTSDIR